MLAAVLVVAAASPASGATSARVSITDSGISPAAVRIDVGGTVSWRNNGTKRHVVTSLSSSFRPLVLQPRQSKSVTFRLRRCERYSADGRFNGRVLVGVSACAGGGTTPAPGPPSTTPSQGARVHRYDISVSGYVNNVQLWTYPPPPPGQLSQSGSVTATVSWTGTWRNVPLKVTFVGGGFVVLATMPPGRITGRFSYADGRPASACSGGVDIATNGELGVYGARYPDRASSVAFGSSAKQAIDASSVCDDRGGIVPYETFTLRVAGVEVEQYDPLQQVEFKRQGPGVFFPLDKLRDGESFRIVVPEQTVRDDCGSQFCVSTYKWRATISFARAR